MRKNVNIDVSKDRSLLKWSEWQEWQVDGMRAKVINKTIQKALFKWF